MPKNAIKAWSPDPFNAAGLLAVPKQWIIGGPNGGFPQPIILLEITNDSNTACDIVFNDDIRQRQHIRANSSISLNFQTNNQPNGKVSCLAMAEQIWIAGTAGVGFIYITGYYTDQT